jgi:MYXO-CTERM domain-containing protein
MKTRAVVRLASLALLGSICSFDNHAQAFCRATTIEGTQDSCRVCETAGYPLAWEHPDIEYIFNERGFPGLPDSELREIFRDAVDQWQAVTCDSARVEVEVRASSDTTPLGPRDKAISPHVNVMGHLTAAQWSAEDYDPHAFAQTGVRYYADSGVIAGADIWFNGGMGEFGVCPTDGCEDGDPTVDLPNVVTHEMGHFFGLAHSHIDGSTMACDAQPGDTDKRSLAADDRRGMCAIYPPEQAFQGPYLAGEWTQAKSDDSCSVGAPGASRRAFALSGGLGLSLVALAWLRRRRSGRS